LRLVARGVARAVKLAAGQLL
jgi:hypothetical protein